MIYFFGKLKEPGHYLYGPDRRQVFLSGKSVLPFREGILDGGLLPTNEQIQGKTFLSIINGWTIVSMWDRSGDHRGASNSSFLAEGIMTREELMALARQVFPDIVERIENFK